jgi:hypothetical protein
MRRSSLLWAVILILIGVLLLLNNLRIINVDVWGLMGPLFLVALGLWILWGILSGGRTADAEEAVIPLEGAVQARVHIYYGAGRLRVDAGAGPGQLAAGTFGGGLDCRTRRDGDTLDVEMRVGAGRFPHLAIPWVRWRGQALGWWFGLNREIPLSLDFRTGAGDTRLDLADLRVSDLRLQTGASATDLTLPSKAGHTRVDIRAGAASVMIHVPSGVAARVRARGALASVRVDRQRFPRAGNVYQSPDYDSAANKADIDIETGVGSISVR